MTQALLMTHAASLKLQFQRHCFIQIQQNETQPMLVPFVQPVTTFIHNRKNLDWYIEKKNREQNALAAAEVDRLLEQQETALLQAAMPVDHNSSANERGDPEILEVLTPRPDIPIWERSGTNRKIESPPDPFPSPLPRKRGPKPDLDNHAKVASLIRAYGDSWTTDDNLMDICDELDRLRIPPPKTWETRPDGSARSWSRGNHHYPHLVIKAIKDRCKALGTPNRPNAD